MSDDGYGGGPRVEPVDTLAEAIDATMPVLVDLDPDMQSRWSTANLLLTELESRGFKLVSQERLEMLREL